ncbi:MAG: hypothetical protein IV094_13680 [Vitreoscilla sp.]|nr:hypothetical protein [Vitreoscilla sp.]
MQRSHFRLATLLLALFLAGCAGLLGPRSVVYSENELNQMLAKRFPLDKQVLNLLDVSLSRPQLTLRPEVGRLSTEFEIRASERLLGRAWQGRLLLDYGLRLERSDYSLRLVSPRVVAASLDRADRDRPPVAAERLGSLLVETLLDDLVLHRLKPEQVERLAQAGYEPGNLEFTTRGIQITAVPRR